MEHRANKQSMRNEERGNARDAIDMDAVNEVVAKYKEERKKQLGLTEEELENALAMLGIQMVDLLQPDVLQEFILTISNAESIADALINENLAELLSSGNEILNEVMEQLKEFDVKENLDEFLEVYKEEISQNSTKVIQEEQQIEDSTGRRDAGKEGHPQPEELSNPDKTWLRINKPK